MLELSTWSLLSLSLSCVDLVFMICHDCVPTIRHRQWLTPLKTCHVASKAHSVSACAHVPVAAHYTNTNLTISCYSGTVKSVLAVSGSFVRIILTSCISWLGLSISSPTHQVIAIITNSTYCIQSLCSQRRPHVNVLTIYLARALQIIHAKLWHEVKQGLSMQAGSEKRLSSMYMTVSCEFKSCGPEVCSIIAAWIWSTVM